MKKTIISALLLICTLSCLAQWQWLNPLPNGYTGKKITFVNSQTGFILNSNGDLLGTNNRGANWALVKNFPNATCMDIKDGTAVIAGYQGSIHLSADNGTSWQTLYAGIPDNFTGVTVISKDVFLLYNINNTKLYKTTDRGATWVTLNLENAINSISFTDTQVGYIGTTGGKILKTINGGNTWQITSQVSWSPAAILAIQFISRDTGYAFREWSDFLRTCDGGATWTRLSTSFGFTMNSIQFLDPVTGYMGGDDGVIYKTIDSGRTWASVTNFKSYGNGNEIYSMHFFTKDSGFAVGGLGRIQQTSNGGLTWRDYSPTHNSFNAIHFPTNTVGYACTGNNIFKTSNGGVAWQPLAATPVLSNLSYSQFQHAYFMSADTGFVTSSYPAKVFRTTDGGNSFTPIMPTPYSWDNITDIFFLNRLTGYMNITYTSAGSQGTIVKTTDGGQTWSTAWHAAYQGELFSKIFYLNEAKGFAIRYDKLFVTTDSSHTWTPVFTTANSNWLTSIWFVNATKGFLAGEQGRLYETSDGGQTWTTRPYIDTYYNDFSWIKFFDEKVGYLYGGNIFKTYDGGTSWHLDGKSPNGLLRPVQFRSDSVAIVCGGGGNILSSGLKGIMVDSLKLSSNVPCSTTVAVNASAVFTSIDSIWFELTNLQSNTVTTTLATPSSVVNGTIHGVHTYHNLPQNNYSLRVKYLYASNYQYTDAIPFSPALVPTPFIYKDSSNTLSSTSVAGNQWYFNAVAIAGATSQTYTPERTGMYSVMVGASDCHSNMSPPVRFVAENFGVSLFPNPTKNYIYLNNTQNRLLAFKIVNLAGKVLAQGNLLPSILHVPVSNLQAGTYFVHLTDSKTNAGTTIKFIKVN